jgi:hypothetical protein
MSISLTHPLPDSLSTLNWVVIVGVKGIPFWVKDADAKVLTDREHEACQFKSALSVIDEVLYWNRQPDITNAHFTLQQRFKTW